MAAVVLLKHGGQTYHSNAAKPADQIKRKIFEDKNFFIAV
jgi:hypothetical protein